MIYPSATDVIYLLRKCDIICLRQIVSEHLTVLNYIIMQQTRRGAHRASVSEKTYLCRDRCPHRSAGTDEILRTDVGIGPYTISANRFDKLLFAKKLPIRFAGALAVRGRKTCAEFFWCAIMKMNLSIEDI